MKKSSKSENIFPDSSAEELKDITLPNGFKIKTFASNFKNAWERRKE